MKLKFLWKKLLPKKMVIDKKPELKFFEPLVLIYDSPKKKVEDDLLIIEVTENKILKKRTFTLDTTGKGSGFFKSKKLNVIMDEVEQPEVSVLFKNILSNVQR